jgi:hypothetical protein
MKEVLIFLFKIVWKMEQVPEDWKRGAIFPIFKKGNVMDLGNYRGITLLSVVAKMMEAIVNKRLAGWIEKEKRLSDEQGGFRGGRGCEDLIFLLTASLEWQRQMGRPTFMCFIDVTKAYDTVWQDGLWKKLWDVGVFGKVWRFIRGWYQGMTSTVLVDGKMTREFEVKQGVKQGAVLSPLLYAIFVDDVVEEMKRLGLGVVVNGIWVGVMLYADDMALLARSAQELQSMINVVVEFSNRWRFVLSGKKSEVMIVGAKVRESDVWRMGGVVLKVVKEFKYLGVEIQRNGKWTTVCKRLCEKAEKKSSCAHRYGYEGIGVFSEDGGVFVGIDGGTDHAVRQ